MNNSSLGRLLPIVMIAAVLMGNGLFAATTLVPHLMENQQLTADVAAQQAALESRSADTSAEDLALLTRQVELNSATADEIAGAFLNAQQVDELVERLYIAADESGVVITSLRNQGIEDAEESTDEAAFETQVMQIQAEGHVPNLMNFVISFREAAQPVVQLDNLAINTGTDNAVLTVDLRLYLSPRAAGDVLIELIEPLPLITVMDGGLPSGDSQSPFKITESQMIPTPPGQAVNASSMTPEGPCAAAAPTQFTAGQVAIVDFNGESALNVLTAARADAGNTPGIIVQAYDNHRMLLLDGPVCGQWEGQELWYWYVEYAGVQGWVGEALPDNRWLCPESEPECAP